MAATQETPNARHCPVCHSKVDVSSVVCRFCGRNLPPLLTGANPTLESENGVVEGPPVVNEFNLFVRDLGGAVREGSLDVTFCRDAETSALLKLLCGEERHSVLIVGPDGVGKTNLVYGAATALARGNYDLDGTPRQIVQLYSEILEGHHERIPLRLKSLAHLLRDRRNIVIFLDDLTPLIRAGQEETPAAGTLLELIESGSMQCIATLAEELYEELNAAMPPWMKRFTLLKLTPPDAPTTLNILTGLQPTVERKYGVQVSRHAMVSAVDLAQEYLPREVLPGKAIEVLSQACARYRRKLAMREQCPPEWLDDGTMNYLGVKVGAHDVKRVIGELTAIDIGAAEAERWQHKLEERLNRYVLHQGAAVAKMASAVTELRLKYRDRGRPGGIMLLAGPEGVGKVRAARVLAQSLLGGLDDFVCFNMAEYSGKDGAGRFFGTLPERGGDLESGVFTHVVRDTPLAIVAFAGIETAHPGFVYELLRGLKNGCIRDNRGQELSLRNCLMILTMNTSDTMDAALAKVFGSGLAGLILNTVPVVASFTPLTRESVRAILQLAMQEFYRELKPLEVRMRVQGQAYEVLADLCHSAERGLENLNERLEAHVFRPVREVVQESLPVAGKTIDIKAEDNRICVEVSTLSV